MTLDDEERKLLSGLPCDSEGIKVKLDFILSVQKRLDNRPEWRQKTSHIFLSFCKVIDKTSALVQPMLPQAAEWTVTYGILTLLFKVNPDCLRKFSTFSLLDPELTINF